MVFASHSFLAFLAVVLLAYWLAGRSDERLGKPLLIIASFIFYGYWIPTYLVLLSASILFNHAIVKVVLSGPSATMRSALTAIGITLNLGLIGYYRRGAVAGYRQPVLPARWSSPPDSWLANGCSHVRPCLPARYAGDTGFIPPGYGTSPGSRQRHTFSAALPSRNGDGVSATDGF